MSEKVSNNKYYQFDNIYSQLLNKQDLNSETQIINYFDKMNLKEIEPTIQNIHKSIFEEDLSIVIDETVNLIFKELNQGKEENVIKQHVLTYINNHNINPKEIFIWLLNNQINPNSIYLIGYFHYYGIETKINRQNSFELYLKASELGNNLAQLELVNMYMDGEGVEIDHKKAFELSKVLEKGGTSSGINKLGYCYGNGIGTNIDVKKAFELYQKAADLAEGEFSGGITMLGRCYELGIGVSADIKKAFELYQKAANLGNDVAQYNLALINYIG
ncbi:kinase-like domain-containing protein [Rhizophagus irregularis DAOM 181602=DAOM 197198]|nr:kinase-like domain-containing protein [Rhizophagus irregularis DAOM 181602=DAOM 197198]